MEAVSQKLDRTLVNPPKKFWRYSTQTKYPTSSLQIGESLRYKNEGHNDMVDMVGVNKNYPDSIKYIIKLLLGNKMIATKELLKPGDVPDIG